MYTRNLWPKEKQDQIAALLTKMKELPEDTIGEMTDSADDTTSEEEKCDAITLRKDAFLMQALDAVVVVSPQVRAECEAELSAAKADKYRLR